MKKHFSLISGLFAEALIFLFAFFISTGDVYALTNGNGGEIRDGASFIGALGNAASYEYDSNSGIYTISLNDDVEISSTMILQEGKYIFLSSGTAKTISRAVAAAEIS